MNDIYDFSNSFFYGCRNNIRNIVDKKNISEKDHIFAYNKDNGLVISNIKYNKAKLLLSKYWCINNVSKFTFNVELYDNQKFVDNGRNENNIIIYSNNS